MNPRIEELLNTAAVIIAADFVENSSEANGESDDWLAEWEEYGYEDLDDVSGYLNDAVIKGLTVNVDTEANISEPKHSLEFVYYGDDYSLIQWPSNAKRLRRSSDVQLYLIDTPVRLAENTSESDDTQQFALDDIPLEQLREVAVQYDIPLYDARGK